MREENYFHIDKNDNMNDLHCFYAFDSDKVGNPLNELIPMFLSFFTNNNEEIVFHSVSCMRFTIDAMPNALLVNMNNYLQVRIVGGKFIIGIIVVIVKSK